MKNITIVELTPGFSEHRCGAQFELSFEGEDNWLALVAKTDLTKEQAHHMAKLFAAAPEMQKEITKLKSEVAMRDGQIEELRKALALTRRVK